MKANSTFFFGCLIVASLLAGALAEDIRAQQRAVKASTSRVEHSEATVRKTAPVPDYPVIGYLEKRGQTIIIKAGPKGPLYTAQTKEGKILCKNLSADQIRAQVPELYRFLKTTVANGAGKSGEVIDASLRLP